MTSLPASILANVFRSTPVPTSGSAASTCVSSLFFRSLDGTSVHLKPGDVLVQRGTIHNWVNEGTGPCVIAFAQVAAKPVTVVGKVLKAVEQTGH